MKSRGNSDQNASKTKISILPMATGMIFILSGAGWVISNIYQMGWQWGLSEQSIVLFVVMGTVLLLFPFLRSFSLPGGIAVELRDLPEEVKEIRDVQLIGEVVFDKEQPQDLFWIDKNRLRRRLPNKDKDTASLFMTPKGAIGITKNVIDSFAIGPEISAISQGSFRHAKGHVFVILDKMIF